MPQIRRASVRTIHERRDAALRVLGCMFLQALGGPIASTNEENNLALLLAVLRREGGDGEGVRLKVEGADAAQDDIGVLARRPRDTTGHRQANGVLREKLDERVG